MALVAEINTTTLVGRALAGEPDASGALYDELAPKIRRFLLGLRLPLERQDLDDATQETFLRLFRGLAGFDPTRSLRAYALGIARYVAIDLIRRPPPPTGGKADDVRDDDGTPSGAVSKIEQRALIESALAALEPELRSVIALRHVSGLKMKDLAECLNVSAPTARARVREASHQFAIELRQRGVVPEEVCA